MRREGSECIRSRDPVMIVYKDILLMVVNYILTLCFFTFSEELITLSHQLMSTISFEVEFQICVFRW